MATQPDGFHFWHHPDRVDRVIDAITDLPSTTGPSNMTLHAKQSSFAVSACVGAPGTRAANVSSYEVSAAAAGMQNWFR